MQKRLAHLQSRGALVLGKGLAPSGDQAAGPGPKRHALWEHDPIWNFVPPRCAFPFGPGTRPLYQDVSADDSLAEVLAKTRLLVFAGAEVTPNLLTAITAKGAPAFVFEPNLKSLKAFLERVDDDTILANNVYLFCGDFHRFEQPLSAYLTETVFNLGFPVVYATERVRQGYATWLEELTRVVETLFFRHRIYPVEGQALSRSLPMRPITRGLSFDQIKHAYENVPACTVHGRIDELRHAFQGATALCVGAGPMLDAQIGHVKAAKERGALIIAVNNALRTLLAHGLSPHFVVINDTSVDAGKAFAGLPPTEETILVPHALSSTGDGVFSRIAFFGNHLEEIFGRRMDLRLHGSVITTAISLARHLGCATCVLIGVQLASPSATVMKYAAQSLHGHIARTNAGAHKGLMCPIRNVFGDTLYATPNFIDAWLWLMDEIRGMPMEIVNVTRESIVHGHGIRYAEDYAIDTACDVPGIFSGLRIAPPVVDREKMLAWLRNELGFWTMAAERSEGLVRGGDDGPAWLEACATFVAGLDDIGATYMLHRYKAFDNARFHAGFYASDRPTDRVREARYYLAHMRDMARDLAGILAASLDRVSKPARDGTA